MAKLLKQHYPKSVTELYKEQHVFLMTNLFISILSSHKILHFFADLVADFTLKPGSGIWTW